MSLDTFENLFPDYFYVNPFKYLYIFHQVTSVHNSSLPLPYTVLSNFRFFCFSSCILVDNIVQNPQDPPLLLELRGLPPTRQQNLILLRSHIYIISWYTFKIYFTGTIAVDHGPASLGSQGTKTRLGAACLLPSLSCWTTSGPYPYVFEACLFFPKYLELLFNPGMFLRTVWRLKMLGEMKASENFWMGASAMGTAGLLLSGTLSPEWTPRGARSRSRITFLAVQVS